MASEKKPMSMEEIYELMLNQPTPEYDEMAEKVRELVMDPDPTPPRCSHAVDEVVEGCLECGRDDLKDAPFAVRGTVTGRFSYSGANISNLPKCEHGENGDCFGCRIGFMPCSPGCKGWLHMDSPYEIEACDECGRFQGEDTDEQARAAHKAECNCGWPSFDYQHAAMAWMYDIDNYIRTDDVVQTSNAGVMRDFIESTNGQDFMDAIIPVIFLCTQMIDRETKDISKTAINGMLQLMKDARDKIASKELTIKDFEGHEYKPPGRFKEDFDSPTEKLLGR